MKIGNSLLIFIVLLVLAVVVTEPSRKDFDKWIAKKSPVIPPLVKHTNSFGFSLFDVEYYGMRKQSSRDSASNWSTGLLKKERYLGLFGTFWKL